MGFNIKHDLTKEEESLPWHLKARYFRNFLTNALLRQNGKKKKFLGLSLAFVQ
jgi:hypothetical protein